jgi:hypothetical protein
MKYHKKLIGNLAKETEILESLDWNEEQLKNLYEYLDLHFNGDSIITPDLLLEEIKKHYGESCSNILREMFIEVSFHNGLHLYDTDIEH